MVIQEIGNLSQRPASDSCMKSASKTCTLNILPSLQILGSDISAWIKAPAQTSPFFPLKAEIHFITVVFSKSNVWLKQVI